MNKIAVGLFGFGVVGEGVYQLLKEDLPNLEVKKIVIRQSDKIRSVDASLFSTDPADILEDNTIRLIIETTDDADAAFDYVRSALISGRSVVSANKKMIANHLETLLELSKKHGSSFHYEAAVGGAVPIIRTLREYLGRDKITSVEAIVNGTSNFILHKMEQEGLDMKTAIRLAQDAGFAESDPSSDVEGWDAVYKSSIIAYHAFGTHCSPESISREGILGIDKAAISEADKAGKVIKLLARLTLENGKVNASVKPIAIPKDHILSSTLNESNTFAVACERSGTHYLQGKGAGRYPTAQAVLGDVHDWLNSRTWERFSLNEPQLLN